MEMFDICVTSLNSIPEVLNEFEGLKATSCEGYVYLQSPGLWGLPTVLWKQKYCILREDCVYLTKKYGHLIIPGETLHIKIESDTGIYPDEYLRGKNKYYIRIVKDRQTYILCTKTENERNKWLNSLLTIISKKFITNFKSCAYETIRLPSKMKRKTMISRRRSNFQKGKNDKDSRFRLYSKTVTGERKVRQPVSCKDDLLKTFYETKAVNQS